MKRFILVFAIFFGNILLVNANKINKITMDIYIDENGTGHVEEVWNVYANEGTENYRQVYNMGKSQISNLKVRDDSREYVFDSNWDIDNDFNEKSYRCGFNYTKEGTEICWGISHFGNNTYYVSYDISDIIINTSDNYQVFYWTLLPKSVIPIAEYDITIRTDEYLSDNLPVWGFGARGKYAYVNNGVVKLVGEDALNSDEYVVGLIKFDKGTFKSTYNDDRTFNDFLKLAEKGSNPYKESIIYRIFKFLLHIIPYIIVCLISVFAVKSSGTNVYFNRLKYTDDTKKLPKDYPMFRDIPCNKNIYIANYIGKAYKIIKNDNNFIGCIILKWLKDKIISIDNSDLKKPKLILSSSTLPATYKASSHEINLYTWMNEASKDGILTTDEFKKYCKRHYSKILNWSNNSYLEGRTECINEKYLNKSNVKGNSYIVDYTFYDEAVKIAGLKKFLVEFSDMKNKEPIEVHLWEDYLIFAQMFGIAKKVAKQFKDLYPEVYNQGSYDYATFIFIHDFSYTGFQAASSARSAAQSYSAGGGGFSAGGGGGGSFGGGGSMGSR